MDARCPRCGYEPIPAGAVECDRCGVVLARARPRAPAPDRRPPEKLVAPPVEGDAGRRALIVGAVAAVVCFAIPLTRFAFGYLGILIHELGHVVANWAFGQPSIPAFDFAHGGGVTMSEPRQPILVAILAVALAGAAWRSRDRPRLAATIVGLTVAWASLVLSGIDEMVALAAGHGAVLVLAGVFLYRAEAGVALRSAAERPAYAFAGVFLWLGEVAFAWNLATRHEARVEYELAKGGGAWMDLSRIADEFLGISLAATAAVHLAVALVVPAAGLLARRAMPACARCVGWWIAPGEGRMSPLSRLAPREPRY